MKPICTLLLFVFSLSLTAQETALLRVKLEKGDSYVTKIVKKFHGGIMKDITNFETITVKNVIEDTYQLEIDITKIVANLNHMGTEIHYDSSTGISQMSEKAKGLHSRYKYELNTIIGETISNTAKTLRRKKVHGTLSTQTANQKTNFLELPKEAVKIGTQWTKSREENNIIITKVYSVTKITENSVFVSLKGKLSQSYTRRVKGTINGTIQLNRNTGVPIKKEIQFETALNGQMVKSDIIITLEKR